MAQVQGLRSPRARCLLGAMLSRGQPLEEPAPQKVKKKAAELTLKSLANDVQTLEGLFPLVAALREKILGKEGGDGRDGLEARFKESLTAPCPTLQMMREDITALQENVKRIDALLEAQKVQWISTNKKLQDLEKKMEEKMEKQLQELAEDLVRDLARPIQQPQCLCRRCGAAVPPTSWEGAD